MKAIAAISPAVLLCFLGAAPMSAAPSSEGAHGVEKTSPGMQEVQLTPAVSWKGTSWGKLGTTHLKSAPFPDDARTTGFSSKRGEFFPYKGHYDANTVAFAVPKGFRPGKRVDLVVILHGHRNECSRFIEQTRMGEILLQSGRNTIIVVPQGPLDSPDSHAGKLERRGGFTAFCEELLPVLVKEGILPADCRIRNIVLGGFSGGGRGVGLICENGDMRSCIRETWLIDAAYEQHDGMAAPFLDDPANRSFRSIFTDHLSPENHAIAHRFTLAGRRLALVVDDQLTTQGTPEEVEANRRFIALGTPKDGDELETILRREPVLFVHTSIPHDAYLLANRFILPLLKQSVYLDPLPRPERSSKQ